MTAEDLHDALARALAEVAVTRMPFGRFGPASYPPDGVPLYDLPYEYLAYFARKGFPDGRLGELMKVVFDIKRDGADAMFDALRSRAGRRTILRRQRRTRWTFNDESRESLP